MTTRDPVLDPQPGDSVRFQLDGPDGHETVVTVVRRHTINGQDTVLLRHAFPTKTGEYEDPWFILWQEWCRHYSAIVTSAN